MKLGNTMSLGIFNNWNYVQMLRSITITFIKPMYTYTCITCVHDSLFLSGYMFIRYLNKQQRAMNWSFCWRRSSIFLIRRYMAETLPIRRKTPTNHTISLSPRMRKDVILLPRI